MLYAPAMAYSLLVSLAPLTVALSLLTSRLAIPAMLPGSPLSSADLTAEALYGGLGWAGPWASVAALLLTIYGATALFGQLTRALSKIWRQPGAPQGLRGLVRHHLVSLLLLVAAGLALFTSAIVGNVLGGLASAAVELGVVLDIDLRWVETLLSARSLLEFVFASVLFTVTFVSVPRIRPRVRDVLPGALITAAAYTLGQGVLGVYLSSAARFTALGAFGSFLGFIVWVYYTAAIVLWGAELTYQMARYRVCRRDDADKEPYECGPRSVSGDAATPQT